MRSASLAPIDCLKFSGTESLLTGPVYVSSVVGAAEPPTGAKAAVRAAAISVCGSENVPLTRWPVAVALGSATESVASPAVEMTVAVVAAA